MTDAEIWTYVEQATTGILITLGKDGRPVALPVWFATLDHAIYIRTRGRKLERIARDPRVSFLVESGERWAELKAVHFSADAELIDLDELTAQRFEEHMSAKYAGARATGGEMPAMTAEYYAASRRRIVRLNPVGRVLNWDNTKLSSQSPS
jgi:nitroimidazol reductase NimA-like FMN-containing flavoprotein (pyridoxamine 5'-phosphate oxidase superfamily)